MSVGPSQNHGHCRCKKFLLKYSVNGKCSYKDTEADITYVPGETSALMLWKEDVDGRGSPLVSCYRLDCQITIKTFHVLFGFQHEDKQVSTFSGDRSGWSLADWAANVSVNYMICEGPCVHLVLRCNGHRDGWWSDHSNQQLRRSGTHLTTSLFFSVNSSCFPDNDVQCRTWLLFWAPTLRISRQPYN